MESSADQQSSISAAKAAECELLIEATKALRYHIGLAENAGEQSTLPRPSPEPLFWIEVAPPSPRGAKCKLNCVKNIMQGEYRVAVEPGQQQYYGRQDFYHVRCFEKIADFSQADFLDRISPLTRKFTQARNLKGAAILDGNYFLNAGAERLCLEWKVTVRRLIDKRDGVIVDVADSDESSIFKDLLQKAGSSRYTTQSVAGISAYEYRLLTGTLAPNESDGPDDEDEWNLFEQYLAVSDARDEDLNNRHSLSQTLQAWRLAGVLATSGNLTEQGEKLKAELSPKAIRAIKRLCATPTPDFQGAFLRRF